MDKNSIKPEHVQISATNYRMKTWQGNENWSEELAKYPLKGGFWAEYAIKSILLANYKTKAKHHPVIVVLSQPWDKAIFKESLSDFQICSPESNLFYSLDKQGNLRSHQLGQNPQAIFQEQVKGIPVQTVLAFPNIQEPIAFLPNNDQDEIVLKNLEQDISERKLNESSWENALSLLAHDQTLALNPSKYTKGWLPTLKNSFRTGILSHQTSYLVLENEAQKQALLAKQRQTLAAKRTLDTQDEILQMSEPSNDLIQILLLITGLIYLYFKKYRNQTNPQGPSSKLD